MKRSDHGQPVQPAPARGADLRVGAEARANEEIWPEFADPVTEAKCRARPSLSPRSKAGRKTGVLMDALSSAAEMVSDRV
jgi:hypothetical protein